MTALQSGFLKQVVEEPVKLNQAVEWQDIYAVSCIDISCLVLEDNEAIGFAH